MFKPSIVLHTHWRLYRMNESPPLKLSWFKQYLLISQVQEYYKVIIRVLFTGFSMLSFPCVYDMFVA